MIASRVRNILATNSKIFQSISYLTIIQIVAMLLPFLTYPYLIKLFGLSLYGKIMLSQAVVSYVAIFINFGFNISAAKSVAEALHKGDVNRLNTLCSAIICVKTLIWFIVTIIYLSCVFLFIDDVKIKIMYVAAYTLTFNEFLVCQWFYQAREELKIIAISSIVSKAINVCLIFILIKNVDDYYLVSLITGMCFLVTGIYCTYHMFKHHVRFVIPDFQSILKVTQDSINLFLTSAVIAIKNKLDVVLIGIFISSEFVAVYDFAQKILNILLLPVTIINNAVFPKMNREKSSAFLRKVIGVSIAIASFYTLISVVLLPYVIHIIFISSHDSITITRIMMASVIFFSISLPLAQNGLIVFGYTKLHLLGMLSTTLIYILVMAIGYKLGYLSHVYYFVFTSMLLFSYEAIYRFILCKWKKIL